MEKRINFHQVFAKLLAENCGKVEYKDNGPYAVAWIMTPPSSHPSVLYIAIFKKQI
jgi:hypothetical protein